METPDSKNRNEDYVVSCKILLNQLAREENGRLKLMLLDDLLYKASKFRRIEERRAWALEATSCFAPEPVRERVRQRRLLELSGQKRQTDIAVVTIKRTELYPTKVAFGIDPDRREDYEDNGLRFWETEIPTSDGRDKARVVVTMIGEPGDYTCAAGCSRLFDSYNIGLCILVGIAAGVQEKVNLGDVVAAELVLDYERARLETTGSKKRPVPYPLQIPIARDLAHYDASRCGWHDTLLHHLKNFIEDPNSSVPEEINQSWKPKYDTGVILSGAKLLADGKLPEMREEYHDRTRAAEMEGAGFARFCEEYRKPWLVFRGISDYGEPDKHTQEKWQEVSSLAAATAAYIFLTKVYRRREEEF